ncbi:Dynein light chain roadblock-type 2 [Escovopsis weberi]|uniref:Dynein light chain roadblock-type 2 n=1 Tax=Escovopsis weberi TaxID=150374 RepID=A0A0M9VUK1_ESCWE|nr:Dynein light chain roadblock-type 2 [Escovopsis weberi]
MAEGQAPIGHDTPEEKLDRLSRKPGVKASIIIDRETGSILRTSGQLSVLSTAKSRTASSSSTATFPTETPAPAAAAASASAATSTEEDSGSQSVEDFAQMIWNFVNDSGQFVQDLDTEDELRLLRLRTKKHEIVIVPDQKYLLTVIHDMHQA